ncbi:aspartyl-phosphate phosphatase Spo0E family protein [Wukongibacter sp. M2B1]|uniref:aspartyl-phosphate phosphatase Spo0E family protein n=1 Tax=Wukongibacter sp. M2B1 TaxID=3088895 RepID=UPI003D7A3D4C
MGTMVNLLEESRRNLEYLIDACNGNLLDPFVIAASQKLDTIINEYNEFIVQ